MAYFNSVLVIAFVGFFAFGNGAIPWLLPSELVPHTARALNNALTVPANWLPNFIIGISFSSARVSLYL